MNKECQLNFAKAERQSVIALDVGDVRLQQSLDVELVAKAQAIYHVPPTACTTTCKSHDVEYIGRDKDFARRMDNLRTRDATSIDSILTREILVVDQETVEKSCVTSFPSQECHGGERKGVSEQRGDRDACWDQDGLSQNGYGISIKLPLSLSSLRASYPVALDRSRA